MLKIYSDGSAYICACRIGLQDHTIFLKVSFYILILNWFVILLLIYIRSVLENHYNVSFVVFNHELNAKTRHAKCLDLCINVS